MGLYRATLNMPTVRCGKVAYFNDFDPAVQRLVANHFLVPVDATARAAVELPVVVTVDAPPSRGPSAIRAALEAARRDAAASEKAEAPPEVSTAFTIEKAGDADEDKTEKAQEEETREPKTDSKTSFKRGAKRD